MKKMFVCMFLLAGTTANAGFSSYDYSMEIDEYDQSGTYYYNGVEIKEEGGLLKGDDRKTVDIGIFNQTTGKTAYFFNGSNAEEIVVFAYENAFDDKTGAIVFNRSDRSAPARNNMNLPKRAPKDKVILVTCRKEDNSYTLWFSDKSGKKPEKIREFGREAEWHIDMKNAKVKFITQTGRTIKIDSIDW